MILLRLLRRFAVPLLGVLAATAGAQSSVAVGNGGPGPVKAQHLTVEMVAAGPQIAQAGTQTIGFVFSMEEGWHILWLNPGGQGRPPEVTWSLPAGVAAGALQFPVPSWLPLKGVVDYGYEDSIALPVTITAERVAKADKSGTVHLAATLSWVVCKLTCVSGSADLGLDLQLVPPGSVVSSDGVTVGALGGAFKSMSRPLPAIIKLVAHSNGNAIALFAHTGVRESDPEFYPIDRDTIADLDLPFDSTEDGAILRMQTAPGLKTAPKSLHGVLKFATLESYIVDVPIVPGTVPSPRSAAAAGGGTKRGLVVLLAVALASIVGVLLAVIQSRKRRSRKH